jgi:hypothetical protein
MKSQSLKRKSNCQVYKTVVLPAVLMPLSKALEALPGGFERKTLGRIYGAVQIGGVWQRLYHQELYSLFNDVDIIKIIKINRLRCAVREKEER